MDSVTALKAALTGRLHIDPRKNPIHVSLEDDYILIEGMVEKAADKKRALLIAMGLPSAGVIDRLRVRPSARMSDAEIRDHLKAAIESESVLDPGKIRIEVNDGVVNLEGELVSLSHKRLAGVLAWWVPGSTDVINSIEVAPPEEDTDDEVRDALLQVLEKDRLVDASSISVSVKDWAVTLEGVAGSDEEKDAAEDDAWFVWGVNDVVNNIRVEKSGIHELP
ncbi:MAG: BON domain-containing protein [Deltaproteobacteria bacterium]|nr:BON domain-containing protein [Deltaproteobacteria bacterium]